MSRGQLQPRHPLPGPVFSYDAPLADGRGMVSMGGQPVALEDILWLDGLEGWCRWNGRVARFAVARVGEDVHVWLDGRLFIFQRVERRRRGGGEALALDGALAAPVPGRVLKVLVAPGDRVERDQPVAVLESMKMEHMVRAPRAGTVRRVLVEAGAQVERGALLVDLAEEG